MSAPALGSAAPIAAAVPDERAVRELVAVALEAATADETRVRVEARAAASVRYGGGAILGASEGQRLVVSVTCAFGSRHATVTSPDTSHEGVERAVARAEAMAKVMAPDPDWLKETAAQEMPSVATAWDEEGARPRPEPALVILGELLSELRRRELVAAGELTEEAEVLCLGSRAGTAAFHRGTLCRFTTLLRSGAGGTAWTGGAAPRRRDLDVPGLHQRAAELALASRAHPLDPGAYPAVLGPEAVAALLLALVPALDQGEADAGRSPFGRRGLAARPLGELTLRSDAADPLVAGAPFDALFQPRRPMVYFERGALRQLYVSPKAASPALRGKRKPMARPDSLLVSHSGAAASSEQALLQELKRCVYVTHLGDVRVLDPVTLRISAHAHGGAFLMENGRLAGALPALRLEQPLLELLAGADRATAPQRAAASALRLACPALRTKVLRVT